MKCCNLTTNCRHVIIIRGKTKFNYQDYGTVRKKKKKVNSYLLWRRDPTSRSDRCKPWDHRLSWQRSREVDWPSFVLRGRRQRWKRLSRGAWSDRDRWFWQLSPNALGRWQKSLNQEKMFNSFHLLLGNGHQHCDNKSTNGGLGRQLIGRLTHSLIEM